MIQIIWEVVGDIWRYVLQMIPCMAVGGAAFFAVYPIRRRQLARLGLASPWLRECALLLFVLFLAGLAALTLFPSNLWSYVMQPWRYPQEVTFWSFYPTLEQLQDRLNTLPDQLPRILTPFPYGLKWHFSSYWFAFLFFGNMGMFLPVGFFSALLWGRARWWKSLLIGFFLSLTIESIQFFINRGTDLDDLILNTTGALLGYFLYQIFCVLFPKTAARFRCHTRKEGCAQHGRAV